jgi:hypothetical protein
LYPSIKFTPEIGGQQILYTFLTRIQLTSSDRPYFIRFNFYVERKTHSLIVFHIAPYINNNWPTWASRTTYKIHTVLPVKYFECRIVAYLFHELHTQTNEGKYESGYKRSAAVHCSNLVAKDVLFTMLR